MSHFVVLVTDTDKVPVEEQLAPFREEPNDDYPFHEKEYYVKRTSEDIRRWCDEEIRFSREGLETRIPEDDKHWRARIERLEKIKAEKDLDKAFLSIYDLEGGMVDENGAYYLVNPNAKWDWWIEGGRWNGWFVDKQGNRCNVCRVKDVSFENMFKAELEDCAKDYDKEIARAKKMKREPFFYGFDHTPTKEEYLQKVGEVPVAPYAVLHDGEWIEKGEMGWWGLDIPHYTDEEWATKFQQFIKGLDPETALTVVDCHI